MIPILDMGIMALAAGRSAFCISTETIFEPVRNRIWKWSPPSVAAFALDPKGGFRTPGFWGQLVECPLCVSAWLSILFFLAYLGFGGVVSTALTPLAIWSVASIVIMRGLT